MRPCYELLLYSVKSTSLIYEDYKYINIWIITSIWSNLQMIFWWVILNLLAIIAHVQEPVSQIIPDAELSDSNLVLRIPIVNASLYGVYTCAVYVRANASRIEADAAADGSEPCECHLMRKGLNLFGTAGSLGSYSYVVLYLRWTLSVLSTCTVYAIQV